MLLTSDEILDQDCGYISSGKASIIEHDDPGLNLARSSKFSQFLKQKLQCDEVFQKPPRLL